VNLTTYVDKLSSVFMDVGRSAPHHQAIALLYPQSANLQSYLNEYFIVVVGLCHYLFKFGQKSTVQQFTSSLSDSHLMTFQADLDKWANMIKGQMLVNEAQESHGYRDYTKAMLKSTSDQQRRAAKMRVLDFCSTYDHGKDLKQIRKAGNSSLHMRQGEYSAWRDSSYSCTLLCTGKLGSGKSVLLASIVENLSLHTKNDRLTILAYFFCKHDVPESLLARTVIGSLSRQLLCAVPKLDLAAESCESIHMRNTERVLEILLQWFPSGTKAYLVLDGLDECNKEEKETILQAVRTIQEMTTVLVCASSREEPNNGLQLIANQCLATRVVSMPADNPDIEAFVEADLKRRLREQRLTIGDPALILEIRDALLKGSQGMFLWVALQIESLCSIKTDYAIREALADLPKDLSETFARILKRSGSTDPALQAKTLQLVVAAYRPLTTDELREALSVTPGDATWDPSRLINNVYSVLAHCGCLLVVDEEELTVRVVHHSFKQYILNRVDGENSLKFSLTQAQRTLADIVVTYLGYGVFGTELSRAKVNPMVIQSAPSKIVQATMGSTSVTSRLATRFLESGKQPTIDLSRIIAEARNSFNSTSPFKLYSYAIAHWQKHIFYVSRNDSSIHELSSKLIHARRFELNGMSEDYLEHVRSAIRNGNKDILALLHEAWKFDVTPKGVGGWPPLILAASMGDSNIARVLLSVGEPDVNARTVDGRDRTALMLAVLGGHSETVEVLLTVGKADTEIKDDRGFTALMMATYTGNNNVVEILLTIGKANVEAKNDFGETALMLAADCGKADIAELLLRVGKADAEAKNKASVTALKKAVHYRCINTVKVLVILGKADIEARDRHGFTLLMLAVEREWAEGVDFLLGISMANVKAKDDKERTALIFAAQRGSTEVVELLLNVGEADVKAKDNEGRTALMFAAQREALKWLSSYLILVKLILRRRIMKGLLHFCTQHT
jgi:ankyrin repeat protein